MAYPKYESYKDSGVEWLGEIPKDWEVQSLRSILINRNEKNDPVKTADILSLSIASGVTPYSDENRGGNKAKNDLTAYKLAYPGDIVLNSMNVVVGAVGLSKYFGAISPVYYALYPRNKEKTSVYFYNYIFRNISFQKYLFQYGKGILVKKSDSGKLNTIRMKISIQELKKVPLPLPPITEQERIVEFINHKTAEIDEAIAKKQRLIKLLQEQKNTLINQAVIKGLNPKAPMHDSGVEWVGQMPKYWEFKQLKRLFAEYDKRSTDGTEILLSMRMYGGLVPHTEVSNKPIASSELIGYKKVKPGEIVMNRMRAATGLFAISSIEGIVSPDYAVFRTVTDLIPDYFLYLFKTQAMKDIFFSESKGIGTGSSGFLRLYSDRFGWIKVPVPPVEEQADIVSHIERITGEFAGVIDKINNEISLLQELKNIIIAQAVTGKIKI